VTLPDPEKPVQSLPDAKKTGSEKTRYRYIVREKEVSALHYFFILCVRVVLVFPVAVIMRLKGERLESERFMDTVKKATPYCTGLGLTLYLLAGALLFCLGFYIRLFAYLLGRN
jgi:hypothetical protein